MTTAAGPVLLLVGAAGDGWVDAAGMGRVGVAEAPGGNAVAAA